MEAIMSIDNQLLFCYVEEDNIQQAYFASARC